MLRFFLNREITQLQWMAIVMQVSGLFVVQYNPCKGQPILESHMYIAMSISTLCTAVTIQSLSALVYTKT
jgi:hypothetical protein